jgi:hypothetical protein
MEYPKHHKHIVADMLDGKFVLHTDKVFEELQGNSSFYNSFFKESFGYDLEINTRFAYLLSDETDEQFSRDCCIFFAILCYELDKDGRDFQDALQYSEFELYNEHDNSKTIDGYFGNSSYVDLITMNNQLKDKESRKKFVRTLIKRNIAIRTGEDRFMFTPAYQVFIDFAKDFAKGRLNAAEAADNEA